MRPLGISAVLLFGAVSQAQNLGDFQSLSLAGKNGVTLPYRLFVPKPYDPAKTYPLVFALHGAGERGTDNSSQLTIHRLATAWAVDSVQARYPSFILAPQCPPTPAVWVNTPFGGGSYDQSRVPLAPPLQTAVEILDSLVAKYRVDTNRLYVAGLSMGGYATWDLLTRYPRRFAAAVPICGGADTSKAPLIAHLPVWTFHGDSDRTVPVAATRQIVAALKKAGGSPRYTEYAGVDHGSWGPALQEPGLPAWLFSQKRAAPPAAVAFGLPFNDHLVLQRRVAVPVWGAAPAGEMVSVTFRGQTKTATAGADGKWRVNLDATEAGGPFELVAQGRNTVTLRDVMVGEVWLAGGQSNMQSTLKILGGPLPDTAAAANHPNLRYANVQAGGRWTAVTPTTALDMAATAFFFGRDLQKTLDVPVGMLISAVGGTDIERWMDPQAIAADPALAHDTASGILYQRFIAPLAGYAIKGAIWYQGENNARFAYAAKPTWIIANYRQRFEALIGGWRRAWGQGPFPFYYVQLPNINGLQTQPGGESPWASLREAQRLSLTVPNTAMAVTIDIGDADNLHPHNKWGVGARLLLAARARDYGEASLPYRGPMYKSMEIRGNALRLVFRDAEGLKTKDGGKPTGFALAGANNVWAWADAEIRKDTVVLTSAAVAAPAKARYGWGQNPPVSLYNAAGLPASPFQTEGPQLPVALEGAGKPKPSRLETKSPRYGTAGFDALGRRAAALREALRRAWSR